MRRGAAKARRVGGASQGRPALEGRHGRLDSPAFRSARAVRRGRPRWRSRPTRSRRSAPTAGRMRNARPPPTPIRWRPSWSPISGCSRPAPRRRTRSPTSWRKARTGRTRRCWSAGGRRRSPPTPTSRPRWRSASATPLTLPQTMLHCAEALANAGRNAEAAEEARHAWVAGHRRRGRLPAPLVGRGAAGRPLGALPAPCLARSGRGGATGPAPGSAAPRRGRGAAGPAARRPERGRAARRPARTAAARSRHDAGSRPLAAPMPTAPRTRLPCGGAPARPHSATRRRMTSRRSGPSATCSPAACCATAMPPAPMRSPRSTAGSRRTRCWTPSSWRASSHCAG